MKCKIEIQSNEQFSLWGLFKTGRRHIWTKIVQNIKDEERAWEIKENFEGCKNDKC